MSNETKRRRSSAAQFGQPDLPYRPNIRKSPGAMMQQGSFGTRDTESFPQKFVQLVGYRHPDSQPFSWIKARPVPGTAAIQTDDVQVPLA